MSFMTCMMSSTVLSADAFPPAASAVAFYNALSPASGVEVQSLSSVG